MAKPPPRKVVRAAQQRLAHLQSLAALEPFLPRYKITGIRDGVVRTAKEKAPWEDGAKPESVAEMAQRLAGPTAQEVAAMAYGGLSRLAYYGLQKEYRVAEEESVAGFERDDIEPFFSHLALLGPTLLAEPRLMSYLHDWWHWTPEAGEAGKRARQFFKRLGSVLADPLGRPGRTGEQQEAIFADCEKWIPICKRIKTSGEKIWDEPEYRNESYRKEWRSQLAEELSITVADVESTVAFFTDPKRKLRDRIPSKAAFRRVAREPRYGGIGEKTVETIYLNIREIRAAPRFKRHPTPGR